MKTQRAELEWRDSGVPVSRQFDDPYYSLENGLAETRHVFLSGNDLPSRFQDGFHVAELGFGTGLNFLATVAAWDAAGTSGHLHFTSFEAYPMTTDDMARALASFDALGELRDELLTYWSAGGAPFRPEVSLTVIQGDARVELSKWLGQADAWYLDGFSPAKNPELWQGDLMVTVGQHTKRGGTFATYTAAGFVRRALEDAGFDVQRVPGYGRKRHMTVGHKP